MNFETLKSLMESGEQAPGISFWRHGEMIAERCADLMSSDRKMSWRLPSWFTENEPRIKSTISRRMTTLREYHLWHDCGKPLCRQTDSEGRAHYPDHAEISARAYREAGGSEEIASLISKDMICHLARPSDAERLSEDPDIIELLITALCEIHANAEMFGGMESESFKIKWKRLDKLGSRIFERINTGVI